MYIIFLKYSLYHTHNFLINKGEREMSKYKGEE